MQFLNNLFPWSLIDDGMSLLIATKINIALASGNLTSFFSVFFEPEAGRIRPIYWIFNWLQYKFFSLNSFPYHALRVIMLFIICVIIYKIAYKLCLNKKVALFAPFLFGMSGLTPENWYRLGPQEPLLTLFISLLLYFIIVKENIFFSLFFLVLSIFTKETGAFLLLPLLMGLLLTRKKIYKVLIITNLVYMVLLVFMLKSYPPNVTYTSSFGLDLNRLSNNLNQYMNYLLQYYGIFGFMLGFGSIINKNYHTQKPIFLGGITGFLFPLLLWPYTPGRYMLPLTLFLSLFLVGGVSVYFNTRIKYLLFALMTIFVFYNSQSIFNTIGEWRVRDIANSEMIRKVSEVSLKDSKIVMNIDKSGVEWVIETELHLNLLHNRKDLKTEYLNTEDNSYKKGDILLVWSENKKYDKKTIEDFVRLKFKKITTISESQFVYPHSLLGSIKRIFTGKIIGESGEYLFVERKYTWDIYEFI